MVQMVTIHIGPSFEESNLTICIKRHKNAQIILPSSPISEMGVGEGEAGAK